MAASGGTANIAVAEKCCSDPATEDSSESDGETEPAKSFHRRISTNKEIKNSACIKEGYLMKQISSFQRWRKRYFKLKGRKLYYAKDTKSVLFDEIDLTDLSVAECSTKNVNHSFQVITPFRCLVLCADSRREMEEWISALKSASNKEFYEGADHHDFLSGQHNWYAASHARPTYCNVCREALSGVTSHGLSCEVCKLKAHKRCAAKAANNCKWTTLASVGREIIEDDEGNIAMPHQWMEGNLPVSAKCVVCDKTCGSVLRLQDWRCLWCRAMVHTACKAQFPDKCPLGPCRVSIVPPTALHSIGSDDAWEATRPMGCSPLLVFVNSKSGDNQGVKFLRRFKQLLNPAQVFDLMNGGPGLGLRLFKTFNPFRILVCGGDGSIGWVLSELDKMNMHKQCQLGVLPLGTGNDLARVLGWGSVCDDDTQLPQLLEKYEKATTKMLDRWGIFTYEGSIPVSRKASHEFCPISAYEDSVVAHLTKILQSDQHSVVISSARVLCETVRDFVTKVGAAYEQEDSLDDENSITRKCAILNEKLDSLLNTLNEESIASQTDDVEEALSGEEPMGEEEALPEVETTEKHETEDGKELKELTEREQKNKSEKEAANQEAAAIKKSRKKRMGETFIQKEKLMSRANSLKKAVRQIIEHTEKAVDEQNAQTCKSIDADSTTSTPTICQPIFTYTPAESVRREDETIKPGPSYLTVPSKFSTLQVLPTIESVSGENTPCPSPIPTSPSPTPSSPSPYSQQMEEYSYTILPSSLSQDPSPTESSPTCKTLEERRRRSSCQDEGEEPNIILPVPTLELFSDQPLLLPGSRGGSETSEQSSPQPSEDKKEAEDEDKQRSSPGPSSPRKSTDSSKSPTASRRISSGSTLKHAAAMAGRMVSLAVPGPISFQREKSKSPETVQTKRELPIINPLVSLPMWPNIGGGSLISKVLLANADALCAAASPLMDTGEYSLEGFEEKCVMNNYFGIGLDAKITLDFHNKREEHPEKCRSRTKNMMWYGVLGGKELLQQTYKNLEQRVQLDCDGQRIPLPSLQGIVILNISSFAGGANFWGGTKEDDIFFAPSFDDKILEVVAVFGSVQMAASRLINLQQHRIAQCRSITITILGDEGVPVQVDGEAWLQPPGIIKIIHKNRAQMLYRNRHLESTLKTWQEKQRYMTGGARASATQGAPFSEEEFLLVGPFLEATLSLIRSVKIAAIDHPLIERELYQLAAQTATCLEKVYPGSRILESHNLRSQLTDVVNCIRALHHETSLFLREKVQEVQIHPEIEEKISAALGNIEIELKKCSDMSGFVIFHPSEEEPGQEKKRLSKGLFKLKFKKQDKSKEPKISSPSTSGLELPVNLWGTEEVAQWLDSLQLSEYKENFIRHDIRGPELLHLERRDFKDLGISKVGHIKRIQQAIKELISVSKSMWEKTPQ